MTTLTVFGSFADSDGHCLNPGGRSAAPVSAWPAGNHRTQQPRRIPVLLGHRGPELGEVVHLEQGAQRLQAVAVIDLDRADERLAEVAGPLYFSSGARGKVSGLTADDIVLDELSLTDTPASQGLWPVSILPGDVRSTAAQANWPIGTMTPLLTNAYEAARERRLHPGAAITIRRPHEMQRAGGRTLVDGEPLPSTRSGAMAYDDRGRLLGPLEYRPCRILRVG